MNALNIHILYQYINTYSMLLVHYTQNYLVDS